MNLAGENKNNNKNKIKRKIKGNKENKKEKQSLHVTTTTNKDCPVFCLDFIVVHIIN